MNLTLPTGRGGDRARIAAGGGEAAEREVQEPVVLTVAKTLVGWAGKWERPEVRFY